MKNFVICMGNASSKDLFKYKIYYSNTLKFKDEESDKEIERKILEVLPVAIKAAEEYGLKDYIERIEDAGKKIDLFMCSFAREYFATMVDDEFYNYLNIEFNEGNENYEKEEEY